MSGAAKDRTLAQQLSGAFTTFGVLVAGAFFVTALTCGISWAWLVPQLQRSRTAAKAESAAFAAMLDEENGLRGYLMTHDANFLEAYSRGELGLERANAALTASVGADLTAQLLATRLAEERWHERWANAAAQKALQSIAPSMVEGKALFDAYRRDESKFAAALNDRWELLSARGQNVVTSCVALELTVLIAVLFLVVRQHRALRDSVVAPVAALLRHIGRVRDGQLEANVDPAGPRELRELEEGLNDMACGLGAARQSAALRDEALRAHAVQLRQILDASREFSESLNLTYVITAVRKSTAAVGGYERVTVWLMDEERKRLVDSDESVVSSAAEVEVERGHGLAGRAAKAGRITFEDADGRVRFSDGSAGHIRAIAIPLIVGARAVGVLEARYAAPQLATTQAIEVIEMLATHAATALESARLHELTEERSQMDPLTRLFNRRRLDEDLAAECKRCARYRRPLAFVMLDVDHFKAFNDSHGHPQADTALQEMSEVIAGCVRATDTAYRYGGEEFCIVLRETSGEDAMIFAERVRERIEHRFAMAGKPGITASIGVAGFSMATPTPRALVEAADAAMYESKHAGRNRVTLDVGAPPVLDVLNAKLVPRLPS